MSGNLFAVSDHHCFHANTFEKFKKDDGITPLRPFSSVSEMHEFMIEKHNSVVHPQDKVYFLGDVTLKYGEQFAEVIRRFNGKRRLILGNHDLIKGTNLINFFEKVSLWRTFGEYGFVLTHVPIHHSSFRRAVLNVHGHVHYRTLKDPRYMNVSVEEIDYTPVPLEDILKRVKVLREGALEQAP